MSEAVTTYDILCHAPDPAASIRTMSDRKLSEIIIYLAQPASGIPGLVLAMAEAEASARWLADQKDRSGAVGEGSL
jgi:hypothetical protein